MSPAAPTTRRRTTRPTPRRVTPTCQGQQALTGTDPTQGPVPAPAPTVGEPIQRRTRKGRSPRAEAWAHAEVADRPAPCVLCGTPALLRDPYTNRGCHLACAMAQATERGEQW